MSYNFDIKGIRLSKQIFKINIILNKIKFTSFLNHKINIMKTSLLVFALIFNFLGYTNAQNQEQKVAVTTCSITPNFSIQKTDCNTVRFTAAVSSNSSTTVLGYFWEFGDGSTSTSQNPTHNYSNNGNYNVSLTVTGFNSSTKNCCCETFSENVNINCYNPTPCGVSIVTVEHLAGVGNQNNVTFYASTQLSPGWTYTNSLFDVTFDNGVVRSFSGTLNSITGFHQITIPVNCRLGLGYNPVVRVEATVFVTNSNGETCYDQRTENWYPGVCGGGGINHLSIIPNPARNIINIDLKDVAVDQDAKMQLSISNIYGKVEQQQTFNSLQHNVEMDISKLTSGLYVIKLVSNGKIISTEKLKITN